MRAVSHVWKNLWAMRCRPWLMSPEHVESSSGKKLLQTSPENTQSEFGSLLGRSSVQNMTAESSWGSEELACHSPLHLDPVMS
uniref:Uncharacterized protein n=1 Tax=Sphaerodactylus townsendi TaxID=933632 RepID=A0ACB8EA68_9SAUR